MYWSESFRQLKTKTVSVITTKFVSSYPGDKVVSKVGCPTRLTPFLSHSYFSLKFPFYVRSYDHRVFNISSWPFSVFHSFNIGFISRDHIKCIDQYSQERQRKQWPTMFSVKTQWLLLVYRVLFFTRSFIFILKFSFSFYVPILRN